MCTSVQSYKVSTALLYRLGHFGNLLRTPISIGSKIKFVDTMGIGWSVLKDHLKVMKEDDKRVMQEDSLNAQSQNNTLLKISWVLRH